MHLCIKRTGNDSVVIGCQMVLQGRGRLVRETAQQRNSSDRWQQWQPRSGESVTGLVRIRTLRIALKQPNPPVMCLPATGLCSGSRLSLSTPSGSPVASEAHWCHSRVQTMQIWQEDVLVLPLNAFRLSHSLQSSTTGLILTPNLF